MSEIDKTIEINLALQLNHLEHRSAAVAEGCPPYEAKSSFRVWTAHKVASQTIGDRRNDVVWYAYLEAGYVATAIILEFTTNTKDQSSPSNGWRIFEGF